MKNSHLPLSEQTHAVLRKEAERARHDAIAAYATKMAGTDHDLDRDLEAAGIDYLAKTDPIGAGMV